jgi:phosphoglycolate phosphatase
VAVFRKRNQDIMHPKPIIWPRAILFDFDGTLADSYAAITASVNHVREYFGLSPMTEEEVKPFVGRGLAVLLTEVAKEADLKLSLALYGEHHPKVIRSYTHLLPGARETIAAVKKRGCLVGVCSNKNASFTRDLLEFFQLSALVDVVLGPDDVPRPKPAPDMLLTALARLGVAPEEALYIGDMTVDIATARSAGIRVWVVPTGSVDQATLKKARPDRILDNLGQLPKALDELSVPDRQSP